MPLKLSKDGESITTVESWFAQAPPKGGRAQWVDGRSAKELAKAWCGTGVARVPAEVLGLFQSHHDFADLEFVSGEPEAKIRFDAFRGEPRNTDLALVAESAGGPVAVSVEAKADEPFDRYVGDVLAAALERKIVSPRSRGVERAEQLASSLFAPGSRVPLHRIRYQLMTAAAGAIAWARTIGSSRAVLLIQEFRSSTADKYALRQNERDLDRFLSKLDADRRGPLLGSGLHGPFRVPGSPLFDVVPRLYIGKVISSVEEPGPGQEGTRQSEIIADLLSFACPAPLEWARVHAACLSRWERQRRNEPPPPEPLILGAWSFTSTEEKHARWASLIEWMVDRDLPLKLAEIGLEARVGHDEDTGSADSWPFPFSPHANTSPREVHAKEVVNAALARLSERWNSLSGSISRHTRPLRITGRKSRRLVVEADFGVSPPWGSWTTFPAGHRRSAFTEFRRSCNEVLAPVAVDHIDFIPAHSNPDALQATNNHPNMTLQYDPNADNWRRVHTSEGKFVCLLYVGPGTSPSDAEAELRKILRLDSIMLRKIPGKGEEYHEMTPPLPFEVIRPGAE